PTPVRPRPRSLWSLEQGRVDTPQNGPSELLSEGPSPGTPENTGRKEVSMTYTSMAAPPAATVATKQAIIYLRVSTDRQAHRGGEAEGYSIPAQRDACTRKAESLGARVVSEFVDPGESARSADRPELQALLKRVALKDIDYVIVHKLDRLARDRYDDALINQAVKKAGAKLVSVSEAIDESPQGMLMHGIMASMAEFYSANLAAESKKGSLEKAKRGGTPGKAPLGYIHTSRRQDGHEIKSIEADPDRAPLISWAFKAYARSEERRVGKAGRRRWAARPDARKSHTT